MWVAHYVIKQYEWSRVDDVVCGLYITLSNNMKGLKFR